MRHPIPTLQSDYEGDKGVKVKKNPRHDSAGFHDTPVLLQREAKPAFPRRSARPEKKER
jgi:hypothetical protein